MFCSRPVDNDNNNNRKHFYECVQFCVSALNGEIGEWARDKFGMWPNVHVRWLKSSLCRSIKIKHVLVIFFKRWVDIKSTFLLFLRLICAITCVCVCGGWKGAQNIASETITSYVNNLIRKQMLNIFFGWIICALTLYLHRRRRRHPR